MNCSPVDADVLESMPSWLDFALVVVAFVVLTVQASRYWRDVDWYPWGEPETELAYFRDVTMGPANGPLALAMLLVAIALLLLKLGASVDCMGIAKWSLFPFALSGGFIAFSVYDVLRPVTWRKRPTWWIEAQR